MSSRAKRIERPRSKDAVEYRKLYKTAAWKAKRPVILARDLYTCQRCGVGLTEGRSRPTDAVVNHKVRHEGDWDKFLDDDNLEAACKQCHDSAIQSEERGRRVTFGADGWPTQGPALKYGIPRGLLYAASPVTLVFGPPAAGKTTYVNASKGYGDQVIDLDDILRDMYGTRSVGDFAKVKVALRERDKRICALAQEDCPRTWVVMTGKTQGERDAWKAALGPLCEVKVIRGDPDTCIQRLKADHERRSELAQLIKVVQAWR